MNDPHPQDDPSLARWLAALRGERSDGEADLDAQSLRTLLQAESAREQAAAKAGGEDFHADRLVERLRREGLLDAAVPAAPKRASGWSWSRSLRWALPSAAVALAALWMVVPPPDDPYGEPPGYRGTLQELGTTASDPRASAEATAAALRAAGVEASIYSARPVYYVDLDVTDTNRDAVQAALKQAAPPLAAASVPAGTLRLRFQKP
jgi:hypothetical protein